MSETGRTCVSGVSGLPGDALTLMEPVHSLLTIQIACDILIIYLIFLINMYIVVFKLCVDFFVAIIEPGHNRIYRIIDQ